MKSNFNTVDIVKAVEAELARRSLQRPKSACQTSSSNKPRERPRTAMARTNTTVYKRLNRYVQPLVEFKPRDDQLIFSLDRKTAMEVKDCIVNPYETVKPCSDPISRADPGYEDLKKRDTVRQDLKSREIKDYQGRLIVKLDDSHGLKNGGLIGQ